MDRLRCKLVVREKLKRLGFLYEEVKPCEGTLNDPVAAASKEALKLALQRSGREITDGRQCQLVK